MNLHNLEVEERFLRVLSDASYTSPGDAQRLLDSAKVTRQDLYLPAHGEIMGAMESLIHGRLPADYMSVWAKVQSNETVRAAGGRDWVRRILLETDDAWEHALPTYAKTIRDLSLRRRIILTAREAAQRAQDESADPESIAGSAAKTFAGLSTDRNAIIKTGHDLIDENLADMEAVQKGELRFVPTGIRALDAIIGGWQPYLNFIGALPAVGKTALSATSIALMTGAGRKVGLFSLEDPGKDLTCRILASESGINQYVLRNRPKTEHQMKRIEAASLKVYGQLGNLFCDDRTGLTPQQIVQSARRMILEHGCEVIWIDHWGKVRYDGGSKDRYDLEIERGLADVNTITRDFGVPVVINYHLKRRQGLDPETEPKLTDFRDSAAVERDARVALGLSRKAGSDTLRMTVLKQTNGHGGVSIDVEFVGAAAMIRDVEGEVTDHYGERA